MRRQVRFMSPVRVALVATAGAVALLLALPGAGSFAAWNVSTPLGGTVMTGSLGIDDDALTAGAWTRSGAAFDPAKDKLTAADMITATIADVPVTAVGDNLEATFDVSGAGLPDTIKDHVKVQLTSDPVPVQGSASDADGRQRVTLTLAVIADDRLPSTARTIDLTDLTVTLSNGHAWSDTATLDAGTVTTGKAGPEGGTVIMSFDRALDDDDVVGFYLQNPAPGTKIKWNLWNVGGVQGEYITDAVDGLNSLDYSGYSNQPWIEIVGSFEGMGSPEQTKSLVGALTAVQGWTTAIGSTSASYAFKDAVHLKELSALPDTLTDTSYAFQNAGSAYEPGTIDMQIVNWDSSKVTTMAHMFDGATNYRQYNPTFNTSNVVDMSYMFAGATSFATPVSFSSTANVTTMEGMFQGATRYVGGNGPVGNIAAWDVSSVMNMTSMFEGATSFNANLGSWNTSAVTSMRSMFKGATLFNQDISGWDTSSVTDMSAMFQGATALNKNLNTNGTRWDVSQVTTMANMFDGATTFNGDITGWNTGSVTTMENMFKNAVNFNGNIGRWDTSDVVRFSSMFNGATAFNGTIGTWDTPAATNMSKMFEGATSFTQDVGGWDTATVSTMQAMFKNASTFSQDLSGWDVAKVTNYKEFGEGSGLTPEQLPLWDGATSAMATPRANVAVEEDADQAADEATSVDGPAADDQSTSASATTPSPAGTDPGGDGADATAPVESPAPEPADPDQAVADLEAAWMHAQESDTDEARQALDDAADAVDALLGEGSADEIVHKLEDEAAATASTPSARPMATPEGEQAD